MDAGQKAFDRHFEEWREVNADEPENLSIPNLTKAAYAAGWNAALDWAAKQIQGDTS